MSQSSALRTLPIVSTRYTRIAEQPGGRLLVGEEGWTYTDLGFIVDRQARMAWQVPIGSALGREDWNGTKGYYRIPRSYRITMWGADSAFPLGKPTADELVTMAVYITSGQRMRDATELDMSIPEFRAAWRDLDKQITTILSKGYEVEFPD